MSQLNQDLPNGLPPQMIGNIKQDILPPSSNGLGSTSTSRGSSPGLMQIPASQLPPRTSIPASQLPPSRTQNNGNISNLAQNYSRLSVSGTSMPQATPTGSPKPVFNTSTPIESDRPSVKNVHKQVSGNFATSNAFSPINVVSQKQSALKNVDDDSFKNVPLDPSSENDNYVPTKKPQDQVDVLDNNPEETYFKQSQKMPSEEKQKPNENASMPMTSQSIFTSQPLPVISQLPNASQPTSAIQMMPKTQNSTFSSNQTSANLFGNQISTSTFGTAKFNQNPNENQPPVILPSTSMAVRPPVFHASSNQVGLPTTSKPSAPAEPFSIGTMPRPFGNQNVQQGVITQGQFQQNMPRYPANRFQQPTSMVSPNLQQAPIPPNNTQQSFVVASSNILSPQNIFPLSNFSTSQSSGTTASVMQQGSVFTSKSLQQSSVFPPNSIQSGNRQQISAPSPINMQQNFMTTSSSIQQSPISSTSSVQQSAVPPSSMQHNSGIAPTNMRQSPAFPSNTMSNVSAGVNTFQNRTQNLRPNLHANRYPLQSGQKLQESPYTSSPYTTSQMQQNTFTNVSQIASSSFYEQQKNLQRPNYQPYGTSVTHAGFNKLWGHENVDLLQCPNILPPTKVEAPKINLGQDFLDAANCSTDIFRCTITKIPETNSLLQKSRLPLGILIHPFKDLEHLPVIQCSTIVRCRACRTYINPFVFFVDAKRWKCNLCYRLNELPEEFQFDPVSKTYGDPSRRPEIKSSTIEYIAPSEYMLRPPQPAVYLFLLDVSRLAVESGYLLTLCNVLAANLSSLPGDARTQIGFLAYNSVLHFYSLADGLNQPHEMTVLDIEDVFLPCPDNLVVNLNERKGLIMDLLALLPMRFKNSCDNSSALGAALQAAHKMIAATGGRITVFQTVLPNKGPGGLTSREDPSQRSNSDVQHLNPANDFYKRLALECSGQQIAVDLFILNSQYVDLATISGISRFSGGCIYHFPLFKESRIVDNERFERTLRRYLTRKIGFEAVMRIRCTRGLAIHTFHGNFFVRSTDLLSLPNINPDAGFGMQISIEENLSDLQTVCFQAALLYTSSKGERRIRVHTLCIPVASVLPDIIHAADQQCIIGLLSKMAVDRSLQSNLSDAREAFLNVAIDVLSSYKLSLNMDSNPNGLLAPNCLKLLPLYISALLKHPAFRTGTSTRLDDRIKAMCDMKTLPLFLLMQHIYPDLYPVHNLEEHAVVKNSEGEEVPQPPRLQLSARSLENKGAYIMNQGDSMILFICSSISIDFLASIFGVSDYNAIPEDICELPLWENPRSQRLNMFINYLNDEKPFPAVLQVIRDNSPNRHLFIERLLEDRVENALSYHEFLQHLKTQVK